MCGMPRIAKNLSFSVPAGSRASGYLKSAGLSFCFFIPAVKTFSFSSLMPTNRMSCPYFSVNSLTCGMAARHGGHQVAQKSMATRRVPGSGRCPSHLATVKPGIFLPRMSPADFVSIGAKNSGHFTSTAGFASVAPAPIASGFSFASILSSTSSARSAGSLAFRPASLSPT